MNIKERTAEWKRVEQQMGMIYRPPAEEIIAIIDELQRLWELESLALRLENASDIFDKLQSDWEPEECLKKLHDWSEAKKQFRAALGLVETK